MKKYMLILICSLLPLYGFGQKSLKKRVVQNENTEITEIYYLKGGKKQGEYSFFYGGNVQIKGNYEDGLKNGIWVYSPTKNFSIIGEYENDLKSNRWVTVESMDTTSIMSYKNGKLHGRQLGFHKNGKLAAEINYENGGLHGSYSIFSEEGELITRLLYFNNTPINVEKCSVANPFNLYSGDLSRGTGSLTMFKINRENSRKQTYLVSNFKDSVLHGQILGYDDFGKILFKGQYLKGFMDGKWTFFNLDWTVKKEKTYSYESGLVFDTKECKGFDYQWNHLFVQKMPQIGGNSLPELGYFIARKVRYPVECQENGVQGSVFVQFTINCVGQIVDAKVILGVHPQLNNEALRVINSTPMWIPCTQFGLPVDVTFTAPVNFVLR